MPTTRPQTTPLGRPVRLAVLISGGGTTLENLIQQIDAGSLHAQIPIVISSRTDCSGNEKAQRAGLQVEAVPRKDFRGVREFSQAIFDLCRRHDVDLVLLAGFLSLIEIPEDFQFRVMNIHPALIPSFCGQGLFGQRVHEAVLKRGVRVSGCTVHFADNEYDHGPIIVQRAVPVLDDDTPATLAARVFEAECEAYPKAVRLFAAGQLRIVDGRLMIHESDEA